jgi:hypothetical protein
MKFDIGAGQAPAWRAAAGQGADPARGGIVRVIRIVPLAVAPGTPCVAASAPDAASAAEIAITMASRACIVPPTPIGSEAYDPPRALRNARRR